MLHRLLFTALLISFVCVNNVHANNSEDFYHGITAGLITTNDELELNYSVDEIDSLVLDLKANNMWEDFKDNPQYNSNNKFEKADAACGLGLGYMLYQSGNLTVDQLANPTGSAKILIMKTAHRIKWKCRTTYDLLKKD